jgi:hypothetical protein
MQKAILVFDAKDAMIVAEIDSGKASDCIHILVAWSTCPYLRTKLVALPKNSKIS